MRVFIRNLILVLTVTVYTPLIGGQQCVTLPVSKTAANYSGLNTAIANFNNVSAVFNAYKTELINANQPAYMYMNYYNLLNYYAVDAGNCVRNVTLYINYVLTNLTAAASNNSTTSTLTSLIDSVNYTLNQFDRYGNWYYYFYGYLPNFAFQNMTDIVSKMVNQLTYLQQTVVGIQQSLNTTSMSTYTLLGFIIPSYGMAGFAFGDLFVPDIVSNFMALSAAFKANGTFMFNYMNNVSNLMKSTDPNMIQIEAKYNSTNSTLYSIIPPYFKSINASFTTAIINMTTTVNNFINTFSSALKNDTAMSNYIFEVKNYTIPQFLSNINDSLTTFANTLDNWLRQQDGNMNNFRYEIFMYAWSGKSDAFYSLFENASFYKCGETFIKNANAYFNQSGGAAPMFTCYATDAAVFNRINNTLQLGLMNIQAEFQYMMSVFAECVNILPTSRNYSSGYYMFEYAAVDCFSDTGTLIYNLQNLMDSSILSVNTITQTYLTSNNEKENLCLWKSQAKLLSQYGLFYNTFQNCRYQMYSSNLQVPSTNFSSLEIPINSSIIPSIISTYFTVSTNGPHLGATENKADDTTTVLPL